MRKTIFGALALCLVALAASGGGYDSIYSRQGAYASRAGGGAAESPWTGEIKTALFCMDSTVVHESPNYVSALAAADTVVELGADTSFAYVSMSPSYTGGNPMFYPTSYANNHRDIPLYSDVDWDIPNVTTTVGIMTRFDPFLAGIPANAQIVSASINYRTLTTYLIDDRDSVVTVLMNRAGDNVWWQNKGLYDGGSRAVSADLADFMSHANWLFQVFGGGSKGYPGASTDLWSPALSDRQYYTDWADPARPPISDWARVTPPTATAPFADFVSWDITDCVQGIVDGEVNNGMFSVIRENGVASGLSVYFWETREALTQHPREPWIEIKWVDRRSVSPFPGGADFAFVFTTDDGKEAFNDTVAKIWNDEIGGTFTCYIPEKNIAGASTYDVAGWYALWAAGNGIGPHSRYHDETHGLATWTHETVMPDVSSAAFDSLLFDANNEWMYEIFGAAGYDTSGMRASGRFGATMALPLNSWSPEVLLAITDLGYTGVRVGLLNSITATLVDDYVSQANYRDAVTDSLRLGQTQHFRRDPMNLVGLPFTNAISDLVGAKGDSPSEADVYARMSWLINQIRGQNRGAVGLYDHDFKSGPYADGIDPEQLRGMATAARDLGGWVCSAEQYAAYLRTVVTFVATPAGYAQADTFKYTAGDKVWGVLDGVDNRFIPGVK